MVWCTSAPAFSSRSTMSVWPSWLAIKSGLIPFCTVNERIVYTWRYCDVVGGRLLHVLLHLAGIYASIYIPNSNNECAVTPQSAVWSICTWVKASQNVRDDSPRQTSTVHAARQGMRGPHVGRVIIVACLHLFLLYCWFFVVHSLANTVLVCVLAPPLLLLMVTWNQ